jgi:predicted DNA-binding transcriptional regulator YafY
MPPTRNALLRYRTIDSCLSNRNRRWTWSDILEEVNRRLMATGQPPISKTTIFEDFKDLEYRVFKAPIEKYTAEDKRRQYLRYADPEYSISKQPLSEGELEHIRSLLQLLSRFRGLPQFQWLEETLPRLQADMRTGETDTVAISFDQNREYVGTDHLQTFFNAIHHRRVLKITYKDFKVETPYERIFHPYHLRQYNHRWFAFGHDPSWTRSTYVNLALDRVLEIQETDAAYLPTDQDWEDFFHDLVGVTRSDGPPVDVRVRIMDEEQVNYIRTKPLHHSQKLIRKTPEGHFETSIRVIPNMELQKLLLSFGRRIRVLAPESLVEEMRKHVAGMSELYAEGSGGY